MPETTDRNRALNAASGAASKRLKEENIDRWNELMTEEAKARGEEWKPKASPEQKAEADFKRLIEQYPHLAQQVLDAQS